MSDQQARSVREATNESIEIDANAIAIVGIASRVPGARNIDEYWRNLKNGVESIRHYKDEELLANGELPENLRKKNYVRTGAPLDGMEMFDGEFFGFSPKESAIMDPQHRQFLETAWEAMENAGHPPEKQEGPVGVWAGCGPGFYFTFNLCTNPELVRDVGLFLLRHTGNDKDFLPTRVSYLFDLHGPSISVQTACSSSMTAIHLACQSLLAREVDMALAGGVTVEIPHRRGYLYHEGEVLSPDGHCHAFDHRAQGTVFGSGAGVVVLRRLEDALQDGDHIWAVIRGSAVNNDGSTKVNYLAPSVDGQARCMVEAYGIADVPPDTIDYIECHGTGTYLGDPIEIAALTQAFRESTKKVGFCRIGSVKSNIGHLDNAAGVASVIKAALALHHKQMPPSLNYEKPNPTIDFATSPFVVNDRLRDWTRGDHPRRAAVNSLGVGGTNAHLVLEEAPEPLAPAPSTRAFQLITLSAKNNAALEDNAKRLAAHLEARADQSLADIAWTLHVGRREFDRRRVVVARDHAEAVKLLREQDPRRVFSDSRAAKASIVFAFPGGGAQYARMAVGLYDAEPVFRQHMDRGLELLKNRHGIDLRPMLFCASDDIAQASEELEPMPHQLPAIFIVEYALAQLWKSWGVEPAALIGHSLGENTAACIAGVMSFEDALGLVTLRGKLFAKVSGGAMTSVNLTRAELEPLLPSGIDIAVINVPDVTVVSGPVASIEALEAMLAEREIEAKRLAIPVAAHSHMLEPILGEFRTYLRSIKLGKPKIPFLSNGTGAWISDAQATDPEYWVRHLRGTVDFAACLSTLFAERAPSAPSGFATPIVIEVGPGRTLGSLTRQHPAGGPQAHVIASLRHKDEIVDDAIFFLTQVGRVWAAGGNIDWERVWPGEARRRVPLPTYAFQHQPFFIHPGKVHILEEDFTELSKLNDIEQWGWQPVWRPRLAPPADSAKPHTWLLFMDAAGLGRRLRERLVSKGHTVISVWEGDAYVQRSDIEYSLAPERGREGYVALLTDLLKSGHSPTRVAHFWMVTTDESYRPGSSFFHRNQERGFYSLFFLAQAIADEGLTPPIHITAVTNGMTQVEGEPLPYPEKSTLIGPIKVIPREMPGITCSAIDVRLPETNTRLFGGNFFNALIDPFAGRKAAQDELDAISARLETEMLAPPQNAVVAFRGPHRYEENLEPQHLIPVNPDVAARVRDGSVVIITGGLGGLGLLFAEHLAQTRRAKLILVGRTELPPANEWDAYVRAFGPNDKTSQRIAKIRALESMGATVTLEFADVTIESELRDVVLRTKHRYGRIDGVIHTAGVVKDALISQKTQGDCEDVFTPKIHGTLVLDRVLAAEHLDFFVLFSSTSCVIGAAGQVDYVAANTFLNAFAQSRRERGIPVTAVGWGIWNHVGMAHDALATRGHTTQGELLAEAHTPMLDAHIREASAPGDVGRVAMVARWHQSTHWFLDEHRTRAGQALIPGTGYLELARQALAEQGETMPFEIEDLFFIRPLAVGDEETKEVRVRLEPTPTGYSFEVRSRTDLDGRIGWELHAQANLLLTSMDAPKTLPIEAIEARCDLRRLADPSGIRTPQEAFLRFGPRWRVLHEIRFGQKEAIADLALDPRFASDLDEHLLHPALLDLATGFAMDLIPDYDGKTLWVPIQYESVRVFGGLTPRVRSWVKWAGDESAASEIASFDVVVSDPEGRVLLEVKRFSIKRTAGTGEFVNAGRPTPSEVELEPEMNRELSPAEAQLAKNLERGILPQEGVDAFDRVLEGLSQARIFVSSMDLDKLVKQAERSATTESASGSSASKFARPNLDTDYVEARDDVERTLVGYFQDLLGVEMVGVRDSFFDLGGHSLIAVRLFAKIKKTYTVDFPISVLFEAPSIERIADRIRERIGTPSTDSSAAGAPKRSAPDKPRTRYTHLVGMHPRAEELDEKRPKAPFFIVAGMFGNVLNLRHLAHLIGTDRRFYGLQALGLYGDTKPHETFEEMAEAYLAEMKTVQPHGPYMIGGFSGGGITAYEMAQQLTRRGEEVSMLLLLDTPLPHRPPLSSKDRALIQMLELRQKGPNYLAEWAQRRLGWEVTKLRRLFEEPEGDSRSDEFRSEIIGDAFRKALPRYELRRYEGKVTLFRPKLQPAWVVGEGRMIDKERHYVTPDNGWTPWVSQLEIHEVPGDHDSMVLEPNVRVLARRLRKCIDTIERSQVKPVRRRKIADERDDTSGTRMSPARLALQGELEGITTDHAGAEE